MSGAIFGPSEPRTDSAKLERKRAALKNLTEFLRPLMERPLGVGPRKYEEGVKLVFEALQNPVINKQVRHALPPTALLQLDQDEVQCYGIISYSWP
jgi:hypothetical protein